MEYYIAGALILGYLLDLLLGDPRWLPHPIVAFGTIISFIEKRMNRGNFRFLKGMIAGTLLPLGVFSFFFATEDLLSELSTFAHTIFVTVFVFYGMANKSLLQEGLAVITTLSTNGIEAGRKRLSWIVGRDTSNLTENQIYTAVFETVSENLSDGVIAPLFYFAIGGIPAMMTYKMINTLDSMIGYKNNRYKQFGHFSAKLDDVANYIPARLTAFLMVAVSGSFRGLKFIFKYGNKHASPNAGYPESAMAGILNCRFGGPNIYHGTVVDKPFIGDNYRDLTTNDFKRIQYVNHASTAIMVVATVFIGLYFF